MSEPLPLWGLLGHADGLNATLAHATESCVTNAQVCLPRVGAPAHALSRRRARVANERKVLQCVSRALCGTHARARPPAAITHSFRVCLPMHAFTGPRRGWGALAPKP
jgi:hypothetical protein